MSRTPSPFSPVKIGRWDLSNRLVMAPLTRNRAGEGQAPTELNARYYGQRASAGLIITEGSQPSAVGQGYLATPGVHSEEQAKGWRLVADAVHEGGGHVVVQLMHVGRVAHPDNKDGLETVAPSAVRAPGEIVTADGSKPFAEPRALETDELASVRDEFVAASRLAVDAGLDGVELHAANGYLLHQFLAPSTNQRTDSYGGSPEARARFVVEVAQAVADEIGADRVGIRISPGHPASGIEEPDAADLRATYTSLLEQLAPMDLAYLSILAFDAASMALTGELAEIFGGPVLLNTGFSKITTYAEVEELLAGGVADAVVVGRPFLANPDLVRRWREHGDDAQLNTPDQATFYGGGAEGYTDYPTLEEIESQEGRTA